MKTSVGAYRQRDLERMNRDELRAVRDEAIRLFNEHLATHDDEPELGAGCESCEYYELLAGAASDLLLSGAGDTAELIYTT